MARARNIKPSLFKNEILGTLDPMITILFVSLWTLADKEGKLEDRPLRIKAETFPYREKLDVNGYLTVLQREGFIRRYEVNGMRIIKITNFTKHQAPHKTERQSELPEPIDNNDEKNLTVKQPLSNGGLTEPLPPDSLIPDSLFIDSLIPENKKVSAKADTKEPAKKFTPLIALDELGVDPQIAKDWLKARGKPLTQTALSAVVREAGKAGISVAAAIECCAERSWRGFNADWYANLNRGQNLTVQTGNPLHPIRTLNKQESLEASNRAVIAGMKVPPPLSESYRVN